MYHCHSCQRPLARYPASLSPRIYRIVPLFSLVRSASSLLGAAALLALLAGGAPVSAVVWIFAVLLAVFGATDTAEGFIAVVTGLAPRRGVLESGRRAKARGWVTIAFGAITCGVAAIGLLVARTV